MCDFERQLLAKREAEIERLRDELEETRAMLVRVAGYAVPGLTEWQIRRVAEHCREEGDLDAAASYIETADYVRKYADHTLWIKADWPDELVRLRDEQSRWMKDRLAAEAADIAEVA